MYDLLIKGGRVLDPAQDIDDKLDIGVNGDKIAVVDRHIPPRQGQNVVDARGKIVTPGLIDIHAHVYNDILNIGVEPDVAGVDQAVTTVVDAGSAGYATFGGFPRYVVPSSRTTVFCFLHLSSLGLSIMPELRDWAEIDLAAAAAVIEANRGLIKGVKLRLLGNVVASRGAEIVAMAQKLAKSHGLPVMVHIGDVERQVSPTLTREVLPLLEPGDILSHVYTAKFGGILTPEGSALPELKEALARGVVLDVAHGKSNFSFDVARQCLARGIRPTTLSTDLTTTSLNGPVYSLPVTMSKLLALGLSLPQVIAMTTINPARALGIDRSKGSLGPGMDADISVLELLSGTWKLEDAEQQTLETRTLLAPAMAVKSGCLIPSRPITQLR